MKIDVLSRDLNEYSDYGDYFDEDLSVPEPEEESPVKKPEEGGESGGEPKGGEESNTATVGSEPAQVSQPGGGEAPAEEGGNGAATRDDEEEAGAELPEPLFDPDDIPDDFSLVDITRRDKSINKVISRERLLLINLDSYRPKLRLPQWLVVRALNPESKIKVVLISQRLRRILRMSAAGLFILENPASDIDDFTPVVKKINLLDRFIKETLLPNAMFVSVNLSIDPQHVQWILTIPPELIFTNALLREHIEEYWYYSVTWERLYEKETEQVDDGPQERKERKHQKAGEMVRAKREKEAKAAADKAALLELVLKAVEQPVLSDLLADTGIPVLRYFNELVEQEFRYAGTKIVEISQQLFEFRIVDEEATEAFMFLIDVSDSQDHLFTFNSHFLELLQDPELADEGRYFLIDATLGKVIEVTFEFFSVYFKRFSRGPEEAEGAEELKNAEVPESSKIPEDTESPKKKIITFFDIIDELQEDLGKIKVDYYIPLDITVQNPLKLISIIIKAYPINELMSPFEENIVTGWEYDYLKEEWNLLLKDDGETPDW